jgi:hypothetical protein
MSSKDGLKLRFTTAVADIPAKRAAMLGVDKTETIGRLELFNSTYGIHYTQKGPTSLFDVFNLVVRLKPDANASNETLQSVLNGTLCWELLMDNRPVPKEELKRYLSVTKKPFKFENGFCCFKYRLLEISRNHNESQFSFRFWVSDNNNKLVNRISTVSPISNSEKSLVDSVVSPPTYVFTKHGRLKAIKYASFFETKKNIWGRSEKLNKKLALVFQQSDYRYNKLNKQGEYPEINTILLDYSTPISAQVGCHQYMVDLSLVRNPVKDVEIPVPSNSNKGTPFISSSLSRTKERKSSRRIGTRQVSNSEKRKRILADNNVEPLLLPLKRPRRSTLTSETTEVFHGDTMDEPIPSSKKETTESPLYVYNNQTQEQHAQVGPQLLMGNEEEDGCILPIEAANDDHWSCDTNPEEEDDRTSTTSTICVEEQGLYPFNNKDLTVTKNSVFDGNRNILVSGTQNCKEESSDDSLVSEYQQKFFPENLTDNTPYESLTDQNSFLNFEDDLNFGLLDYVIDDM